MKANVKSVDMGGLIDLDFFVPDNPFFFSLWLVFVIGVEGGVGGDCFRINVCTPSWLQATSDLPAWGKHMLIVNKYDLSLIVESVEKVLSEIDEPSWVGIAEKVASLMEWEFEDYA